MRTKEPLSVELGPGILTQIFDGIQRPLQVIAEMSQSVFVPRGVDVPPLDMDRKWNFIPNKKVTEGSMVSGGLIYGHVFENNLFDEHKIMLPPRAKGKITYIAEEGTYTLADKVIEIEYDGKKTQYGMSHLWPVRQTRPIVEKLQGNSTRL